MAVSTRTCIVLLLVGILQTEMASSVRSQDRRKENARLSDLELLRPKKMEENSSLENICDVQAPISIYCYCDSLSPSDATTANCYVFNETDSTSTWIHFRSQPNITELTLNLRPQGKLETVPQTALKTLQNLRKFKVTGAEIKHINTESFPNLDTLIELDLADNQVENIEKSSFTTTRTLKSLLLNDNVLKVLCNGQFRGLMNLETLLVNSNMINLVEDGAFTELENLLELNLEKNNISVVTMKTFDGLSNLQTLLLQKNALQIIADDTFVRLTKLRRLNLRSNQIEILGNRAFYGLKELQDLNLQGNRIHQIGESTWNGLSALFYLNLRDNQMSTLNESHFIPMWDSLVNESMSFFLEGNPIECSCQVKWLKVLRNSSRSMALQTSLDSLLCEKPQPTLMEFLEATCFESTTATEEPPTTTLTATTTTTTTTITTLTTTGSASTAASSTQAETTTPAMSSTSVGQTVTADSTSPTTTFQSVSITTADNTETITTTTTTLRSENRESKNLRTESKNHDDFLQKDAVVLPEPTAVTDKNSNSVPLVVKTAVNNSFAATTFKVNFACIGVLFYFCVSFVI